MRRKHVFPEAIPRDDLTDGPWTIRNQQVGMVNLSDKIMAVPLIDMPCGCGTVHSQGMVLHEYGHVAFTPADYADQLQRAGLNHNIANGVEDARLKVRLETAMGEPLIDPTCPGSTSDVLGKLLTSGDFTNLMGCFAGSYGSDGNRDAADEWVQAIKDHDAGLLGIAQVMESAQSVLRDFQSKDAPVYADTIEVTKKLQYFADAMKAVMDAIKRAAAEAAERAATGEKEPTEEVFADDGDLPQNKYGSEWGTMTIERVPLVKPARAYPSRKWTSRDEGVLPSAMHRFATDGRIFKQPAHRPEPLTVLVDCSGSMQWSWSDLQVLLDKAPATTVALYSGRSDGMGKLRIVAERGKKCDPGYVRQPYGAGNIIDGWALRWLAKQDGKRLWVSDGHVTGKSEGTGPDLLRDTVAVVSRNKIMRVNHHQQAMEVVTGKKPFKATKGKQALSESHRAKYEAWL